MRLPELDPDEAHPGPDEGVGYCGAEVYLGRVGLESDPNSRCISYGLQVIYGWNRIKAFQLLGRDENRNQELRGDLGSRNPDA